MKPRVRFVLPVWGPRYIKRFTDLALPSFLAPGNLPALADLTDLEIVLLTASENYGDVERESSFRRLRSLAPVRFISIDDLIGGQVSGVILTFAYLRAVTDTGEDMVNRHFLFINADIILADGSLRSVAKRILAGGSCILANSIRAASEDLEQPLLDMVDWGNFVLAVPPRRLVAMALKSLHPTQVAKIVGNELCHSIHVNQFYWQIDADTLISRHFLMFMLCIRPQRVVTDVRSFCDYSFVPEMCQGIDPEAMEDSDDFFALELQYRGSENEYLRIGKSTLDEIAQSLSVWTTKDHRENALKHTLVFHAAELPPETQATCLAAGRYIETLQRCLTREPQPFRDHPYWVGAYAAFLARKGALQSSFGNSQPVDALPPKPLGLPGLLRRVYKLIYGYPPRVRIWHFDWLDYRAISCLLARHMAAGGANILYVKSEIGCFEHYLWGSQTTSLARLLADEQAHVPAGALTFSLVLVELQRSELRHAREAIDRLRPEVAPGGQIAVYLKEVGDVRDPSELEDRVMQDVGYLAPPEIYRTHFVFAGGRSKKRQYERFNGWVAFYRRHGHIALPFAALGLLSVSVLAVINNVRQAKRQDRRESIRECSSFLMTIDL